MQPDGSFRANGGGAIAGVIDTVGPSLREFLHDYTGFVDGTVRGRDITGVENVTFVVPCTGQRLRIGFSGSK